MLYTIGSLIVLLVGLIALFNKNLAWKIDQRNDDFSQRTDAWEVRTTIFGLILTAMGLFGVLQSLGIL